MSWGFREVALTLTAPACLVLVFALRRRAASGARWGLFSAFVLVGASIFLVRRSVIPYGWAIADGLFAVATLLLFFLMRFVRAAIAQDSRDESSDAG